MKLVLFITFVLASTILANPNVEVLSRMETVALEPQGPFAAAVQSTMSKDDSKLQEDIHSFGRLHAINSELTELINGNKKVSHVAQTLSQDDAEKENNIAEAKFKKFLK